MHSQQTLPEELDLVEEECKKRGVNVVLSGGFGQSGKGWPGLAEYYMPLPD